MELRTERLAQTLRDRVALHHQAARDMDAIAPEIVDAREGLRLLQARHPLLMTTVVERVGIARRSTREPVPRAGRRSR